MAVKAGNYWRFLGRKGADMASYKPNEKVYRTGRADVSMNVEVRNVFISKPKSGTKIYAIIKERVLNGKEVTGPLGEPLVMTDSQPRRAALQITFTDSLPQRCSSIHGPSEDDIDYVRVVTPIRPIHYEWKKDEKGRLYRAVAEQPFSEDSSNAIIYVPLYTQGYVRHIGTIWEVPKADTDESVVRAARRSCMAGTAISSGQLIRMVMF